MISNLLHAVTFVGFSPDREIGMDLIRVEKYLKNHDGKKY